MKVTNDKAMRIYFYRPGDDQFWIGCSKEEAEKYFLPRMDKTSIMHYLEQLRRNKEEHGRNDLFLEIYGINNIEDMPETFFNVSRNLDVCFCAEPIFPIGGQWNGYNPFCKCDQVDINNPEELKDIVITLKRKSL